MQSIQSLLYFVNPVYSHLSIPQLTLTHTALTLYHSIFISCFVLFFSVVLLLLVFFTFCKSPLHNIN